MVDSANLKIDCLHTGSTAGFARVFAAFIVQYVCALAQALSCANFLRLTVKYLLVKQETLAQTLQSLDTFL